MNGRLALGAGMLAGLAFDNVRRATQAESDHHPLGDMVDLSDGSRLHYVERGSGPPVLLIHGAFMQLEDMGMTLLRPLSERFRTIAVDRPGHGHSTRPFMSGALMTQAAMIREAMDRIGVERPIVVGHSLGGAVALAYALQFPEHVAGLVILGGYAYPTPRFDLLPIMLNGIPLFGPLHAYTLSAAANRAYLSSTIERIFAPNPVPEYFEAGYPGSMLLRPKQLCATGEDFSAMIAGAAAQYARYREIAAPMAIVTGAEDRIVWPQYHSQPLKLAVPGASLELLPGVGHMVHHVRPDVVLAAVDRVAEQADTMAREFALAL